MPEKTRANGAHCQKVWALAADGADKAAMKSTEQKAALKRRNILGRSPDLAVELEIGVLRRRIEARCDESSRLHGRPNGTIVDNSTRPRTRTLRPLGNG